MATYYVAPTGRSTGAGTVASPMSFARALGVAGATDEILLLDGQYPKLQITKPAIVRAVNRHGPKVRGSGDYGVQILAAGVTVDGLDVQAGSGSGWPPHGIVAERGVHHVTIINNRVHDCPGSGISCAYDDYYHIEGNECFNNAAGGWLSGISIYQPKARAEDAAWIAAKGARIVVRGNHSHHNLTKAGEHTDGNGIIIDDFQNLQNGSTAGNYVQPTLVEGNLVHDNGGKGIQVTWADNVTVRGNTSVGNGLDPLMGTWRGEISISQSKGAKVEDNIAVAKRGAGTLRDNRAYINTAYNNYQNTTTFRGNIGWDAAGTPSVQNDGAASPGDGVTWIDPQLGDDFLPRAAAARGKGWGASAEPEPEEPEEPEEPVEPTPVDPHEAEIADLKAQIAASQAREGEANVRVQAFRAWLEKAPS